MGIKLREVLKAVGGKLLGEVGAEETGRSVSTDSRTLEAGDVFFALEGARFDGHDFLGQVLDKGASLLVVSGSKKIPAEPKKKGRFVQVEDTLRAYGDLAKRHRRRFKVPAVAITGSSGKTTVKDLLSHLLSARFRVLKNRGTENNLIGVPKTLLQLDGSHEAVVVEMGTSVPGEIDRLASIVAPQIGILTQIGPAHLEGLGDLARVKAEKLSMVPHIERGGVLVLNGQEPGLADVGSGVHRVVRAGFTRGECDLAAEQVWCHEQGASFYLPGNVRFDTQLVGRHNVLNCLLAIAAAEALGLERAALAAALPGFKPVHGRFSTRVVEGIHFIDDTYNSNPQSFTAALETLKEFKTRERKGVVCGDMLELGEEAERLHREAGARIAELLFDYVIAAGPFCRHLVDEAVKRGFDPTRIHHVKDSLKAGQLCREVAKAGDRVLVKGSRGTHMGRVFECFITSSTP